MNNFERKLRDGYARTTCKGERGSLPPCPAVAVYEDDRGFASSLVQTPVSQPVKPNRWLDYYAGFAAYLSDRCSLVGNEPEVCRIFALQVPE